MDGDDLRQQVLQHGQRLGALEGKVDQHEYLLRGTFDPNTNTWRDGIVQQLADAVKDISEIRKSIGGFVDWAKDAATRVGAWLLGILGTGLLAIASYAFTHWTKVEALFR